MDGVFIPRIPRDVEEDVADVCRWFFWFRPVRIFGEGRGDFHVGAWHGEGVGAVAARGERYFFATSGDAEVIELVRFVWRNGDGHLLPFGGVAVYINRAVFTHVGDDVVAVSAIVWWLVRAHCQRRGVAGRFAAVAGHDAAVLVAAHRGGGAIDGIAGVGRTGDITPTVAAVKLPLVAEIVASGGDAKCRTLPFGDADALRLGGDGRGSVNDHGAGRSLAAILCSNSDGRFAGSDSSDFAALIYRGNSAVITAPCHSFVGGVIRRYRGGQGFTFTGEQGEGRLVQRNTSDRNGVDSQRKLLADDACAVGGGYGKVKLTRCGRGAGDFTIFTQI